MAKYVTQTTPPLALKWTNQQIVLDCESEPDTPAKLLYPRPGQEYDQLEALQVYNRVKAQYEARRKAGA